MARLHVKEIKDGAIIEPFNFTVIKDLIVDKSNIEAKVNDLELSLQCIEKMRANAVATNQDLFQSMLHLKKISMKVEESLQLKKHHLLKRQLMKPVLKV